MMDSEQIMLKANVRCTQMHNNKRDWEESTCVRDQSIQTYYSDTKRYLQDCWLKQRRNVRNIRETFFCQRDGGKCNKPFMCSRSASRFSENQLMRFGRNKGAIPPSPSAALFLILAANLSALAICTSAAWSSRSSTSVARISFRNGFIFPSRTLNRVITSIKNYFFEKNSRFTGWELQLAIMES